MAINPKDDYESLAKLLYPSIEASGNVYYGQTRKLTLDEVFDKNDKGFHSHIETSSDDEALLCWRLGPLKGTVKVPHVLPSVPMCFAKYELVIDNIENTNNLYSGAFKTYEHNISAVFVSIERTYGYIPSSNNVWDGANFYITLDGTKKFLYIALKDSYEYKNYIYEEPAYIDGDEFSISCKCGYDAYCTVTMYPHGFDEYNGIYEYSINNASFTPFVVSGVAGIESTVITLHNGDTVKFRLVSGAVKPVHDVTHYTTFGFSYSGDASNHSILLGGDIRSIQGDKTKISKHEFYKLFSWCEWITDASNLRLPSGHVEEEGCRLMFEGCRGMSLPPTILPAYDLGISCYSSMFKECVSLLRTPELPATELVAGNEYMCMFSECSSLASACVLPSLHASTNCYSDMFYQCTQLSTPPRILAITAEQGAFSEMFYESGIIYTPITYGVYTPTEFSNIFRWMFMNSENLLDVYSYVRFKDESEPTINSSWLASAWPARFYCDNSTAWEVDSDNGIPLYCVSVDIYKDYGDATGKSADNDVIITSGTESLQSYGKMRYTDTQKDVLYIIPKEVNPLYDTGAPQLNTFSSDGSYNQSIYGWKCFNGPVSFRGGLYTDNTSIFDETREDHADGEYNRQTRILSTVPEIYDAQAEVSFDRHYAPNKPATHASVTIRDTLTVTYVEAGLEGNDYAVEIIENGEHFTINTYRYVDGDDRLIHAVDAASVDDLSDHPYFKFNGTLVTCSKRRLNYGEVTIPEHGSTAVDIGSSFNDASSQVRFHSNDEFAETVINNRYDLRESCIYLESKDNDNAGSVDTYVRDYAGEFGWVTARSTLKVRRPELDSDRYTTECTLSSRAANYEASINLTSETHSENTTIGLNAKEISISDSDNKIVTFNTNNVSLFGNKASLYKPTEADVAIKSGDLNAISEISFKTAGGTLNRTKTATTTIIAGSYNVIDASKFANITMNSSCEGAPAEPRTSITLTADTITLNGTVNATISGITENSNNARNLSYNNESLRLETSASGMTAYSSIVPDDQDNDYSLGDNNTPWATAYISTGSVDTLSTVTFTSDGAATFNGSTDFSGDVNFNGNIPYSAALNRFPTDSDSGYIRAFKDVAYQQLYLSTVIPVNSNCTIIRTVASNNYTSCINGCVFKYDSTICATYGYARYYTNTNLYDAMFINNYISGQSDTPIVAFTSYSVGSAYTSYGNIANITNSAIAKIKIGTGTATTLNGLRMFALGDNSSSKKFMLSLKANLNHNLNGKVAICKYNSYSDDTLNVDVLDTIDVATIVGTAKSYNKLPPRLYDNITFTYTPINVIELLPDMIYISLPVTTSDGESERGLIFTKSDNTWALTHVSIDALNLTHSPFSISNYYINTKAHLCTNVSFKQTNCTLQNGIYYVYSPYYVDKLDCTGSNNFFIDFYKIQQ